MHLSTFKSLNKKFLYGGILFILSSLFLTSCDNFLKADEIKDEIEKVIAYQNAQKVKVLIKADAGTGSFLINGEKEFVIGFSEEEIQFTANKKAIVFKGLEAVSKNNPNISRNDCIEFLPSYIDDNNGIYTYTIKILKNASDLCIKPKYILKPAVISVTPEYDGDYSNFTVPIVLKFNQSLENVLPVDDNPLFSSRNIKIKASGIDITSYFYEPTITKDKDSIEIIPIGKDFNTFFTNSGFTTTDITVQFIPSQTNFIIENEIVPISEDKPLNYTFLYTKNGAENEPPVVDTAIELTKSETGDPIGLDSTDMGPYDIDWGYEIYDIDADKIKASRTKGPVYISGTYIDSGSGINSIMVEEVHISDNGPIDSPVKTKVYKRTDENMITWSNEGNGKIAFKFKHNIESEDGLIKLLITVKDAYQNAERNPTEKFVVKTTGPDLDAFEITNWYIQASDYEISCDDPVAFNMEEYQDNLKNIKLIYYPDDLDETYETDALMSFEWKFAAVYCGHKYDPNDFFVSIKCEYYDDSGVFQSHEMDTYTYEDPELEGAKNWNHTLINVKDVSGLPVTITITDDFGNTKSKTYTIPQKFVVSNIQNTEDSDKKNISLSPSGIPETNKGLIVYKENDDDENSWKAYCTWNLETEIKSDYTYYFIPYSYLTGNMSQPYSNLFTFGKSKAIELNGNISFTESPNGSNILVNVPIKKEIWSLYDTIYLREMSTLTSGQISYGGSHKYSNNESVLQYEISFSDIFRIDDDSRIVITGIQKNGKISEETVIYLEPYLPANRNSLDIIPPQLHCYQRDLQNLYEISIQTTDYQSNLKTVEGYLNNSIRFYYKDGFSGQVHISETIDITPYIDSFIRNYSFDSNSIVTVRFIATDKNNNTAEKEYTFDIQQSLPVYFYSTDSSYVTFYTEDKLKDALIQTFENEFALWTNKYSIPSNNSSVSGVTITSESNKSKIKILTSNLRGKFIRLTNKYSVAQYYYINFKNSDFLNSGRYDDLKTTGHADSFIVSSDAPVFVHTIVTSASYDECSLWSLDEWEFYKKQIGNKMYDFEARNQKQYIVPTDQIQTGQCYVVVAYFADGSSIMSEVMVKE